MEAHHRRLEFGEKLGRLGAERRSARAGGNGLRIPAFSASSSLRMPSGASIAQGSEPRPPAFDTAIASALSCTPAMGAWMRGCSMPSSDCSVVTPLF